MGNVTDAEREVSFKIRNGVEVHGGFLGWEASLGQRVPKPHRTVLSGDIDVNDANSDQNYIDESSNDIEGSNSFHVVVVPAASNSVVLDAVTVTGGKADGPDTGGFPGPLERGGGIFCESAAMFTNVTVIGNFGRYAGGVHNFHSSPTFVNVSIINNSGYGGGGMVNDAYPQSESSPLLANVTFYGNTSVNAGGAMANNGSNGVSFTELRNVTFAANSTDRVNGGGAIANEEAPGGTTDLKGGNVHFWGNLAAGASSHIASFGGDNSLHHSVNEDAVPIEAPSDHGGWTPTLLLSFESPATNAGDPGICIGPLIDGFDQRGYWRFTEQNAYCDVGAMESNDSIFFDGFE